MHSLEEGLAVTSIYATGYLCFGSANRNSLDKALARALFVKWRIEMRFAA